MLAPAGEPWLVLYNTIFFSTHISNSCRRVEMGRTHEGGRMPDLIGRRGGKDAYEWSRETTLWILVPILVPYWLNFEPLVGLHPTSLFKYKYIILFKLS